MKDTLTVILVLACIAGAVYGISQLPPSVLAALAEAVSEIDFDD